MKRFRVATQSRLALILGATVVIAAACSSPASKHATRTTPVPHQSTTTTPPSTTTSTPPTTVTGGALHVPVPAGLSVSPPTSITADCSKDVSKALREWFKSLGAGTTVVMHPGSCYSVDEGIRLKDPQGLTIYGGTFRTAVVPRDQIGRPASDKGQAVFTVLGGTGITFEAMQISGANSGGYDQALAFAAGIDFQGTSNATVRGVTISHTFGDGITLAPLRGGSNHNSGTILAPVTNAIIDGVTVDGAGRQGITLASVSGAQIGNVILKNIGLDNFDIEADQGNEGANNVVISGCVASGGAIFFSNGGQGSAPGTFNIQVDHCTMTRPQAGSAILVVRKGTGKKRLRGPFVFDADVLRCGSSAYVGCVQLTGANVTVSNSQILFPDGSVHEAVYGLRKGSVAAFLADVVRGYGREGHASRSSTVHITGGIWTPANNP